MDRSGDRCQVVAEAEARFPDRRRLHRGEATRRRGGTRATSFAR
jgi:hypothetical protein